jgi:hypothetical protein
VAKDRHDLLRIYVRDHHTASTAGVALVRRCTRNNAGTEFEPGLEQLAADIAADQVALEEVIEWLRVSTSRSRLALARAAELVARLKSNGRIVRYSPSSRVVELEALTAGVSAKRELWLALQTVTHIDPTFDDPIALVGFDALVRRASEQLEQLLALHHRAVELAFLEPSAVHPVRSDS